MTVLDHRPITATTVRAALRDVWSTNPVNLRDSALIVANVAEPLLMEKQAWDAERQAWEAERQARDEAWDAERRERDEREAWLAERTVWLTGRLDEQARWIHAHAPMVGLIRASATQKGWGLVAWFTGRYLQRGIEWACGNDKDLRYFLRNSTLVRPATHDWAPRVDPAGEPFHQCCRCNLVWWPDEVQLVDECAGVDEDEVAA